MQNLFEKYILDKYISFKQERCIKAIKYMIKERLVYTTASSLIRAHDRYMDMSSVDNPLLVIKKFYKKDLECKKEYIKNHIEKDNSLLVKSIEYDTDIIKQLNDAYILKYDEINNCIRYVDANKKYLNEEQQIIYLSEYYSLIGNNVELDQYRIRTVK